MTDDMCGGFFDDLPTTVKLSEIHQCVRRILEGRNQARAKGFTDVDDLGSSTMRLAETAEKSGFMFSVRVIFDTDERMFSADGQQR
jgi:hypothetical protein